MLAGLPQSLDDVHDGSSPEPGLPSGGKLMEFAQEAIGIVGYAAVGAHCRVSRVTNASLGANATLS